MYIDWVVFKTSFYYFRFKLLLICLVFTRSDEKIFKLVTGILEIFNYERKMKFSIFYYTGN